jgi:hypothetical protein
MKKMVVVFWLLSVSACSGATGFNNLQGSEYGIIEIRADARGIEAYHQGLHGMVESAKNAEGQATLTHETYRFKERERTAQKTLNPFSGFLSAGRKEEVVK